MRYSSEVTAWGLGPAQPTGQKVCAQLLPALLVWSGKERPRPSGHHTTALGNPPPEVATAAAEGHLGRLLEDGVDVLLEQSRALEVGHGAHGPCHLLALTGRVDQAAVRWVPLGSHVQPTPSPLGHPRCVFLGHPQLLSPGLIKPDRKSVV